MLAVVGYSGVGPPPIWACITSFDEANSCCVGATKEKERPIDSFQSQSTCTLWSGGTGGWIPD